MVEWQFARSTSPGQLGEPPLEEATLGRLPDQRQRASVGRPRLLGSPQASAQVGAGGVREVVVGQLAAAEDRVERGQPRRGIVVHRHRNGAVQFHHRRRLEPQQQVIEGDDLRPVGGGGGGRLGMDGRDGRL
uniref:Uncharacterized protein n=1 Tax=Acinetobacter nosocomialis TaxID=106654 RepID=A0A7S9DQF3_ACINO|nr:hypothetical protein WM98B_00144 [Acinetobacter nosocomialis]